MRRPEVKRNYCLFVFGGINVKNVDIRSFARKKGVNLWEVSERLGYAHETEFSRVLRHELPEEKKNQIRTIIRERRTVFYCI